MKIDLMSTIKGSLLENFIPSGWDLERIDSICNLSASEVLEPGASRHDDFEPV